ncbi:MAG: hypothetical protein ACLTSZ_08695 [Lachnospiraceae bacterium]
MRITHRRSLRSLRSCRGGQWCRILPTGLDGLATGVTTMAAVFLQPASGDFGCREWSRWQRR